jgi:hypothetical protein
MADEPTREDVAELRREAASRRRELRAAEQEWDALRARVAGYERDQITRLAGERLANGEDLLLAVQLDDLHDDQGALSEERINAAIDQVLEQRPHWGKAPPEPEFGSRHPEFHNGARETVHERKFSFGEALKNAR